MVESWPRLHAAHAPPHYEQSALRNEFYFSHLEVAAVSTRLGCFSSVILPEVGFLICVNVSIRFLISQDHISLLLKRSFVLLTDGILRFTFV